MKREGFLLAALMMPQGRPAIQIKGFHMVETKLEKRTLQVDAVEARVFRAENVTVLHELKMKIWSQGDIPYLLEGRSGVMSSQSQDVRIEEDSKLTSPELFVFETKNINYQATTRTLFSNEDVKGFQNTKLGSSLKVEGRGLLVKLNESTYEILKNVRAEQTLAASGQMAIRSIRMKVEPALNNATFFKQVTVKSPNLDLRGERLVIQFDSSEPDESGASHYLARKLILDSGSKRITAQIGDLKVQSQGLEVMLSSDGSVQSSEAIGEAEGTTKDGVRMTAERLISETEDKKMRVRLLGTVTIYVNTRVATCQEAIFYPETGDIILKQVASVKTDKQTLKGEVIRFSTKNSEVIVEKASGTMGKDELRL